MVAAGLPTGREIRRLGDFWICSRLKNWLSRCVANWATFDVFRERRDHDKLSNKSSD
jgi:hypothetical protein